MKLKNLKKEDFQKDFACCCKIVFKKIPQKDAQSEN